MSVVRGVRSISKELVGQRIRGVEPPADNQDADDFRFGLSQSERCRLRVGTRRPYVVEDEHVATFHCPGRVHGEFVRADTTVAKRIVPRYQHGVQVHSD